MPDGDVDVVVGQHGFDPRCGRILVLAYAMAVEDALSGEVMEIHESTVRRRWLARSKFSGAFQEFEIER